MILSAADDERISLLEIFKNYPTNMRINARGLLEISDELQVLAQGGQRALEFIRSSIFYDIICPSSQRVALKSADDAGAIAADTVSCASRNAATRNASAS
ncbi:MAG: hypothetical protein HC925_02330 [Coleofasciculaceae cyanobacterium SM2_3_26]|nr:hypothetical protein [Coleofasciculaceae cyanobacterium SM2_3_26]